MKTIVLYKEIDDIQVGHLYEHIFCNALVDLFLKAGLYSYIDYHIEAYTHYKGFIELKVDLYSEEAIRHKNNIYNLNIKFTNNEINAALIVIMAEKKFEVEWYDYKEVKTKLKNYHQAQWLESKSDMKLSVDFTESINFKNAPLSNFCLMSQSINLDFNSITLDKSNAILLFMVISDLYRNNLQDILSYNLMYFSSKDKYKITKSRICNVNEYYADRRQNVQLTIEQALANKLKSNLKSKKVVDELSTFLLNADSKIPGKAPDNKRITDLTNIKCNDKTWHEIGTPENILEIMSKTEINFIFS